MTIVQPTVQWLESSSQSPPEFRIPFESSRSKTSLPSSSPSAPPWPWPPCWPPCWPRGYWGRPGPGPGPHIYFIVWTFQIGRAAAGTGKGKICLFKTSVVFWAAQNVKALLIWKKVLKHLKFGLQGGKFGRYSPCDAIYTFFWTF